MGDTGVGNVSARLPSGHEGWDCSSAHQASSPPSTGNSISTSRSTFTVINFCILSHLLSLFFLKLHLLRVTIPSSSSGTAMSCSTSGRFSFPASGADQPRRMEPTKDPQVLHLFPEELDHAGPWQCSQSSAAPSDPLGAPARVVVASPPLTSFYLRIVHTGLLLSDMGTIPVGDDPSGQLCIQPACLSQRPTLPCCKGKASKARGFSLFFSGCF